MTSCDLFDAPKPNMTASISRMVQQINAATASGRDPRAKGIPCMQRWAQLGASQRSRSSEAVRGVSQADGRGARLFSTYLADFGRICS